MTAPMRLGPGADPSHCPTCGGEMSSAMKGRRPTTSHLWFRQCLARDRCGITTITEEPPAFVITQAQPPVYLPGSLPFARPKPTAKELQLETKAGEK